MLTISAISRRSDLPRRTVQFWADQGALDVAYVAGETGGIRAYSERELEIARMLRPFYAMSSPISLIKFLATIFRDWLLDPESQTDYESEEFGPIVKAAREGKSAFIVVLITPTPDDPQTMGYVGDIFAANTSKEVGKIIAELFKFNSHLPIVPINLTDALHPVSRLAMPRRPRARLRLRPEKA